MDGGMDGWMDGGGRIPSTENGKKYTIGEPSLFPDAPPPGGGFRRPEYRSASSGSSPENNNVQQSLKGTEISESA